MKQPSLNPRSKTPATQIKCDAVVIKPVVQLNLVQLDNLYPGCDPDIIKIIIISYFIKRAWFFFISLCNIV